MKKNLLAKAALLSLLLGIGGVLAIAISGPGYQNGWWSLGTAFRKFFAYSAYAGMAACILAIIALAGNKLSSNSQSRVAFLAMVGLLTGLVATGLPTAFKRKAAAHPLHDITTNTQNPPLFEAILPLRADASNPAHYDSSIAAQALQLYPDIKTYISTSSKEDLYKKALVTSMQNGWEIVNKNQSKGLIEATDTTFWYGFKDDIVIRIRANNEGSELDIRSKSRIGRSDVGKNSERIKGFLKRL